jgi:nicotinamide-nucleotide amidase
MRCEVVAIGTELLLGDVIDTNSAWIGGQLALAGIDSLYQTKVGDNLERIVAVLRLALERSDAVITCGGLGPTQDDITRAAMAEVMGSELRRDPDLEAVIREMFASRGRTMPENNLRQAEIPVGASPIGQARGTAPGLICPVGDGKVMYAVPGVPYEMREMISSVVIPDLQRRAGVRSTIVSRVVRTWGMSESGVAEAVTDRLDELERTGACTIAFLASGIEGIKVRITAKAATEADAAAIVDAEEAEVRAVLGDVVFGVDEENMEHAVVKLLLQRDLTLALAESLTGGLIASRITDVPGSSEVFRGAVVSYASEVKFSLLDVPEGPVVSAEAAEAMAVGARKLLGADIGLAVTGVAGPAWQDGRKPGTVFVGIARDSGATSRELWLPGDRDRVRQFTDISALDLLRRDLLAGA